MAYLLLLTCTVLSCLFSLCITPCTDDIIFQHWGVNLCSTTEAHALFPPCSCASARKYLSHRSAQQALLYSGNTTARIIIRQSDISSADCKRDSRNCHTTSQSFPSRITTNPNKRKPHNNSPLQAHNLSQISCFPDAHTARTLLLWWQGFTHLCLTSKITMTRVFLQGTHSGHRQRIKHFDTYHPTSRPCTQDWRILWI